MNAEEARKAVTEKLVEWRVPFSVSLVGETKRDDWVCDQWRVKFADWETAYYTGTGHRKPVKGAPPKNFVNPRCLAAKEWNRNNLRPVAPQAADVLHSLLLDSDAVNESFRNWCANYGYSDDSLSALDIYRECCKVGEKMRRLFTHEQRETLRELLEDF